MPTPSSHDMKSCYASGKREKRASPGAPQLHKHRSYLHDLVLIPAAREGAWSFCHKRREEARFLHPVRALTKFILSVDKGFTLLCSDILDAYVTQIREHTALRKPVWWAMDIAHHIASQRRRASIPRRRVTHCQVEALTRFGRRWLWEMTLNVPLLAFENLDQSNLELSIRKAAAGMLDLPISKLAVDLLDLKSCPSGPQIVHQTDPSISPLGSASVIVDGRTTQCLQMVLWSQWTKQHATLRKLPSWIEEPPPRSKPRPARHYLITASRTAFLELLNTKSAIENLRTPPDSQTLVTAAAVVARR